MVRAAVLRSFGEPLVIEEDELFDMAGVGAHLRMRTLVTEEARLTFYHGSEQGELFDLETAPPNFDGEPLCTNEGCPDDLTEEQREAYEFLVGIMDTIRDS